MAEAQSLAAAVVAEVAVAEVVAAVQVPPAAAAAQATQSNPQALAGVAAAGLG